jgi:hypothetical protein
MQFEGLLILERHDGKAGRTAVPTASWSAEHTELCRQHGVTQLQLNVSQGWLGGSIEFLSSLPEVQSIQFIGCGVVDLTPLRTLPNLEELRLDAPVIGFDFTTLTRLKHCFLSWSGSVKSILQCEYLTALDVSGPKLKDLEELATLQRLEVLTIRSSPLSSLIGIAKLPCLRQLSLIYLRKLQSLEPLSECHELTSLQIHGCKNIGSLEALSSLSQLEALTIENCGTVESLQPIAKLPNLSGLNFIDTIIRDGDIGCLLDNKKLTRIHFDNHRHYSHTRREWHQARWPGQDWVQALT